MFLDDITKNLAASVFRYEEALNYLHSRKVSRDEIAKLCIGYCKILGVPNDGSKDCARFMDETWKGKKFEQKVVFPCKDALGRVTALVGRSIIDKTFKVFTTTEADKVGYVLGLHQALPSIYESGRVYVVEGPFDWAAFSKVQPNTVAALTSGINQNQYDMLSLYCDTIVTVFDDDVSGRRGAEQALERKNVIDLNIGYKDPDNCLKVMGSVEKYRDYVSKKIKKLLPF